MAKLAAGDQAPAFQLPDADGKMISLADFADSQVILYFYPAALTPGCTTQAVDFSAAAAVFREAGYVVLGVSPDSPATLRKFIDRHQLSVTLLSDPERTTIAAYGAWGERPLLGKTTTGVIRSTFVVGVDANGQGQISQAQYGVRATGHVGRLREQLGL